MMATYAQARRLLWRKVGGNAVRLKVERVVFNALAKEYGFAAGYLRIWRVNRHRLEDKTVRLHCVHMDQ
jgi:hypothetical protein